MIDKKIYCQERQNLKKTSQTFRVYDPFSIDVKENRFSFTLKKGHIPEMSVIFLKILTLIDIYFYQSNQLFKCHASPTKFFWFIKNLLLSFQKSELSALNWIHSSWNKHGIVFITKPSN